MSRTQLYTINYKQWLRWKPDSIYNSPITQKLITKLQQNGSIVQTKKILNLVYKDFKLQYGLQAAFIIINYIIQTKTLVEVRNQKFGRRMIKKPLIVFGNRRLLIPLQHFRLLLKKAKTKEEKRNIRTNQIEETIKERIKTELLNLFFDGVTSNINKQKTKSIEDFLQQRYKIIRYRW